jgi:hypothetical protein
MNGYSIFFGFLALCSFAVAAWHFASGYSIAGEVLLVPAVANVIGAIVVSLTYGH